jgi:putative FmdB family regulatory protein
VVVDARLPHFERLSLIPGRAAAWRLCDHAAAVPTYDYQCRSCGHTIEVIHSMTEEGPRTCERCGGELRRVLYPTGIIFKGSGFYKTDSRSSGTASASTTSSADSAASTSADTSKSGTGGDAKAPAAAKKESAAG